uniref:SCAN box domain-containing protein n=1 Tax=Seriola dumerili TaxID=41447 RepID=A0A3B4TV12_SERDU
MAAGAMTTSPRMPLLHPKMATAAHTPTPRVPHCSDSQSFLGRNGLTKFSMAQRFHNWTFKNGLTPRSQMHELIRITKKWLEPDTKSPAAIIETLVMDRYLRALPYKAKKIISHQKLTTAMELVEAMEQYQAASDMLRPPHKEPVASVSRDLVSWSWSGV